MRRGVPTSSVPTLTVPTLTGPVWSGPCRQSGREDAEAEPSAGPRECAMASASPPMRHVLWCPSGSP